MSDQNPIVFVVDDDAAIRSALGSLIRSVGLRVELFGSSQEFLNSKRQDAPSCLVLDVRLPGLSGLEFQRELSKAGIHIPIIFITGHGDVPMSVRAMKGGAVDFLIKPFRDQDLLDAIQSALEGDRSRRQQDKELSALRKLFDSLTVREKEVMSLAVTGRLNKQIATEIGTSEITVKVHRANAMRKMHADSLADMVRMAARLGIPAKTS